MKYSDKDRRSTNVEQRTPSRLDRAMAYVGELQEQAEHAEHVKRRHIKNLQSASRYRDKIGDFENIPESMPERNKQFIQVNRIIDVGDRLREKKPKDNEEKQSNVYPEVSKHFQSAVDPNHDMAITAASSHKAEYDKHFMAANKVQTKNAQNAPSQSGGRGFGNASNQAAAQAARKKGGT